MTATPAQDRPHSPAAPEQFDPSLRDLVIILWQRRGIALLAFAVSLVAFSMLIGVWRPDFRAVAEIGLSGAGISARAFNTRTLDAFDSAEHVAPLAAQQIETVIAELKAEETLITALSVLRGEGIVLVPDDSPQTPWQKLLRAAFGEAGTSRAMQADTGPQMQMQNQMQAMNRIRSGLEARRVGNAAVIKVGFVSEDPELGRAVLQAVIESYIWAREDRQKKVLRAGLSEATRQYEAARQQLEEREAILARWQQDAGVLDVEESTMMLDRIYALDEQLGQIERELATARLAARRREAAGDLDDILSIPEVAAHPVVEQLVEQLERKRQTFVDLDQRYGPKHPVMKGKKREITEMRAQLAMIANKVADQLVYRQEELGAELRLVTARRDEWQQRLAERHTRMQGQAGLVRSVELARQETRDLGQRVASIRRELAAYSGDIEILLPPVAPTRPEFPTHRDLALIATLMSLFLAVVVALLRHYFDQTIHADFDPETGLGIHLYARLPQVAPSGDNDPSGRASKEAIGHLAVLMRILAQEKNHGEKAEGGGQVIVIGSAVTGEGKSHIAHGLARSLAEMGGPVLLLDADLHDPAIPEGARESSGELTRMLSGEKAAEPPPGAGDGAKGGYDYLGPQMAVPGHIATALIENGLAEVLAGLRRTYTHIIVDTPPILSVADGILAMGLGDVRLFAVRAGQSRRRDIADALDQLRAAGIVPDGVVLNSAKPRALYGRAETAHPVAERSF